MVEKHGPRHALAHFVLIMGVCVIGFPLLVAFVASTQTAEDISGRV